MIRNEFEQLTNLYRQKYGDSKMEIELTKAWWRNIEHLDFVQAAEAFDTLIGRYDFAFGWEKLIILVDSRTSSNTGHKKIQEGWAKNPLPVSDKKKNELLVAIMSDLVDRNTKVPFDWLDEYAEQFVLIWGSDKAERISDKNLHLSEDYRPFSRLVNKYAMKERSGK